MFEYDYIIIGGGIAGTTAAETIRSRNVSGTIAILQDEKHFLYSRVFLPAFARGEIGLDKVMLRGLGDYEKRRIDVYLLERALKIDFLRQEIRTSTENVFAYKKLLIASGGIPRPWNFESEAGERLFRLQRLEDAERIRLLASSGRIKRALVVGSGFIAIEFLNIFRAYRIKTAMLVRDKYFWQGRVDETGRELFEEEFSKNLIEIYSGDEIYQLAEKENRLIVITKNSLQIEADALALGIGLKRNRQRVNEFLETSTSNVWAAGDVAEYFDTYAGVWKTVGNWTNGFLTGRIAGVNMSGGQESFRAIPSYSIKALDLVLTVVGETEKREGVNTIVRHDRRAKKYSQFFLKGGKIIGAVLINSFQSKPAITKLIELRRDFSGREILLADAAEDLSSL